MNLRPLWSPAATALSVLSQSFGDVIWTVLFRELQTLSLEEPHLETKRAQEGEGHASDSDDPWEDERSWRDPSAHKLRETIIAWLNSRSQCEKLLQVSVNCMDLVWALTINS